MKALVTVPQVVIWIGYLIAILVGVLDIELAGKISSNVDLILIAFGIGGLTGNGLSLVTGTVAPPA